MKNRFILFLATLIGIYSCVPEHEVDRVYIIKNESDTNVKIKFFKNKTLNQTIEIKNGSDWSLRYKETLTDGVEASLAFKSDSAVIFFNNKKKQSYSAFKKNERNFLDNSSYNIENSSTYKYVIIENDFLNAEDCNGNCE